MIYRRTIPVEFKDCDPAGIVFYPRYFEMTNSVVENFFADVLGYPFSRIHLEEGGGVPTVRINCEFLAPSRLGEALDFTLAVDKVGGASMDVTIRAETGGETRMTAAIRLVWVNAKGRAESWPRVIRDRLAAFGGEPA